MSEHTRPPSARGRVHVVAIVGPTAVGKTALSLRLAQALGGEIVSADSRQIYRYMDIGTAKATAAERAAVPHHLIDVVPPDERLTLANYQALATQAIEDIWARGRLPMLVGGTGLYVRALLEGWTIPEVPPKPLLRARLQEEADRDGAAALHARLAAVDPVAAARIDARNVRRVIRALEVHAQTGQPASRQQGKVPPDYAVFRIGLTMPRDALYRRIDARIEAMMAAGLEAEVRWLAAQGYTWNLPAMSGLGYKQIGQYLRGEVSLEEAVVLIKRHTRRFVRQQYNWFRLDDPSILWYNIAESNDEALLGALREFLAQP
ncbi:MAG: tRNA (adenosine(37)-N6)-dimethylallyltransferase MiaA [Chloroflexi bacterium]|jgi:tRNA dimethylallyltransferase|nr:tRNA (adenosine(37)-N6)-dimethylallyltransferase MiaA [Chloroflexota bacterium]